MSRTGGGKPGFSGPLYSVVRFVSEHSNFRTKEMKLLLAPLFLAMLASAQESADPLQTGVSFISAKNCPALIFIGGVMAASPAARAGIRAGDRVFKVNGKSFEDLAGAMRIIRSSDSEPIRWTLLRDGKELEISSERERRSVLVARSGKPEPTKAEQDRAEAFDPSRIVDSVFEPSHYPANPELFYGGFEFFLLRNPDQAMVGGIEEGPASKAGLRWGDILLSVNGTPIAGKTPAQLEPLFLATGPARMRLTFETFGSVKTVEFHLEKAGQIARENGKRFVGARLVPAWVTEEDLPCFQK